MPLSHPQPSQPVRLAKGSALSTSGGQTEGMARANAISDLCDGICASRMIAEPHTASAVHHHGSQDTVIFCASGKGAIVSEKGGKRVELEPGDFCLIPKWMEHQEVNDGEEKLVLCVVRSGRTPEVVNLTGWEGGEA
ncbi:RmlC-like cupin domain-containing protein [Xylariales sp. AK1849]|nr:RmlC-like cupin domain-containing protein [Xylariales sp. AK1849]